MLSDDAVWALHGTKTLVGKDAFAAEADSGGGPNPELTLDRLVEEGERAVTAGMTQHIPRSSAEVLTFGRCG